MMTNLPEREVISIGNAVANFIEQNELPKSLRVNLIKRLHQNIVTGRIEAPEREATSEANRVVYADSVTAFLQGAK